MKSIRLRFFAVLIIAIVVAWLAWAASVMIHLARTKQGWWDTVLSQSAEQILYSLPNNTQVLAQNPAPNPHFPSTYQRDDVTFQVFAGKTLVMRSPYAPSAPMNLEFHDGFWDVKMKDEIWRTYTLSDPTRNLQVQVTRQRNMVHDLWNAFNFGLVNLVILFVILGIATWWIMRWFLREIQSVQSQMKEKSAFDFTPIETASLPKEVKPLVESFNGMLERVNRAIQNERDFIADAAHELRTPLAALSAQAHVSLNAKTEEERTLALNQLSFGVARCARMAEQLLDLARLDAEKSPSSYEIIDLCKLVEIVAHDFEVIAQQRNQKLLVETDPCFFKANVDEIGILLRNLIDNALRYSEDGGTVLVFCKNVLVNGRNAIQIKVADHGPGVPLEERDRIFERFYRSSGAKVRGTGIGLSLVAQIAHSYGAVIEVGEGLQRRGFGISVLFVSQLR